MFLFGYSTPKKGDSQDESDLSFTKMFVKDKSGFYCFLLKTVIVFNSKTTCLMLA